jgi:hypothetical protein
MYMDISVSVNETITIDVGHSYIVSYCVFYAGVLVSHTMTDQELQVAALCAFLNGLMDRSSASEMFSKTERVTVENKRREATIVGCGKMTLVVLLGLFRSDDSAEELGFDPHYVQRTWKILQILKRQKISKAVKTELDKITVKPSLRSAEGVSRPPSAQRRSSGDATPTPRSTRGLLFSGERDLGLTPLSLEGFSNPVFHFAVETEEGLVFSSQAYGTDDHFHSVYQPIYHTYSKLKHLTKQFAEVGFYIDFKSISDPFSKIKLWVCARKHQKSIVFVCYESAVPSCINDLAFQLS